MITKRFVLFSAMTFALALAGCGGGKPFPESQSGAPTQPAPTGSPATGAASGTPIARLLAASQRTTQAKTARLAIDMSISGVGDGGTVSLTGSGAMDLVGKRISMKLGGRAAGETVSLEMRMIGNTVYVATAGHWISESASNSSASTPVASDTLSYLRGISGEVRTEGHDVLRGVTTTRYGATVDLGRSAGLRGDAAQRAALQHARAQFGLAKFPVTVWIDAAGRMRKMALSIDLAAVAAKAGAPAGSRPKIDESIELYDFGAPVDVQPPAVATSVTSLNADFEAEKDLRNALTAEKTNYVDDQSYSADVSRLKQIEPSLDWGGKVKVVVGSSAVGMRDIVCISELSASGANIAVADISRGARAGTYFGTAGCPVPTAARISALATSW